MCIRDRYGMAGVKATVSSTGWAYTLGPSTGYKLVKLTNQWGSGRQFTAGLKRASYTGFPDDEINLYLNLQIRRGSNSPTLLDWYLGPWQHGEETVYIPEIRNPYAGNSTSYELRLNSQLFGVYSWYTIDGNVAGTWATANRYTAAGAHFRNIRVYDDYYQLGDYYWMRQYASQYPDVYFVYDEPPRPGTTTWGVINPSYEWSCQSIL